MAKFHIKDNGEPGKCSAFLRPCPLGASDEEHYSSKEAAREAYEAKMAKVTTPSPVREEEPSAEELAERAEDVEDAKAIMSTLTTMATPEAREEWSNTTPNSFKWKLARVLAMRDSNENGYGDNDVEFANMVMMSAAGERSGASYDARRFAKELIDVNMEAELNAKYQAALSGLPLERTTSVSSNSPYTDERGRRSGPAELNQELVKAEERLRFVAPLCEAYDARFGASV